VTFVPLTPAEFAVACSLFGLLIGSFLNVVIHRLPTMMERDWMIQCAELRGESVPVFPRLSLIGPRSRCPACGHEIGAWENIPLLSYLLLKGRCRGCKTKISLRYPIVEAMTGALSALVAWRFGFSWQAVGGLVFVWALIALAFIDLDTQLLPDSVTQPLLWLGLILNMWNTFTDLRTALIGTLAGYLSLWTVYWMFKLLTKKEGMGYGDFKLLAAIGAWLGWTLLPFTILASSMVGAAAGIAMIVIGGRERSKPIPFGPYLSAAGIVALLWGETFTRAYLRIV
jgi:leader peptidase (prepilin peptidase)/N-methyltransferase